MNPLNSFKKLNDPRKDTATKWYSLELIIFQTLSAVISGAETWVDVAEFGKEKREWMSQFVSVPDGTPSHDTIGDFFKRLNAKVFSECFLRWTQQVCGVTQGELIVLDGKTMRGSHNKRVGKSAIHMISAWASNNKLVLAQRKVNDKSNEITAIPELLELLEIKGGIISIDAMGCQREIAKQIRAQQADYILALKTNQTELHQQAVDAFRFQKPTSQKETIEKNHGRIEQRVCSVINNPKDIEDAPKWKGLKSIIRIIRQREETASAIKSEETHYYISSMTESAAFFIDKIRSHWTIENQLHWVLDVTFKEDHSRVRTGFADQNFAIIRHTAINLLRLDKTPKVSLRNKRNKAAWNDTFRQKLLRI